MPDDRRVPTRPGSDIHRLEPDAPQVGLPRGGRPAAGPVGSLPAHRTSVPHTSGLVAQSPAARPAVGVHARPVGFSPTGDVLPASLVEVVVRGSYAIRSANRVEEQRRKRADAVATHVDQQIAEFLAVCAAENLSPALGVRVVGERLPPVARSGRRRQPPSSVPVSTGAGATGNSATGQPSTEITNSEITNSEKAGRKAGRRSSGHAKDRRRGRRASPLVWPVLYWRNEDFPYTGRCLHLFVGSDGQTFEGRDDPGPLHALGREVRVWPVDIHTVVGSMAEVDARRCAQQLVYGLAHMLWCAGVSL